MDSNPRRRYASGSAGEEDRHAAPRASRRARRRARRCCCSRRALALAALVGVALGCGLRRRRSRSARRSRRPGSRSRSRARRSRTSATRSPTARSSRVERGAALRHGAARPRSSPSASAPFVAGGGFHVDLHALRRERARPTRGADARARPRRARVRRARAGGLRLRDPADRASTRRSTRASPIRGRSPSRSASPPPRSRVRCRGACHGAAARGGSTRSTSSAACSSGRRARALPALAGTALYWAGDVVALWACLRVFDTRASRSRALLLGYATGYALTRRTLPLGGAGVVEALLPFALVWVSSSPLAPAAARRPRLPARQPLAAAAAGARVAFPHVRRLPG